MAMALPGVLKILYLNKFKLNFVNNKKLEIFFYSILKYIKKIKTISNMSK